MKKKEYIKPELCKYALMNKFSMFNTMSAHGGEYEHASKPVPYTTLEDEEDFN